MKPKLTTNFNIILITAVICIVPFSLDGHVARQELKSMELRISLLSKDINDLKVQLTSEPDKPVTKADLITFYELNGYNNQISQLKLEEKMILLKHRSPSNIPFMIVSFMILLYLYYSVKKSGSLSI